MAERRFTRLKASLKDPKETREDVRRELRQSLSADIECVRVEDNYEPFVRSLEATSVWPQNDIQIQEVKTESSVSLNCLLVSSDCRPETSISSGFARECVQHLLRDNREICFSSDQYFGSLFDCFDQKSGPDLRPHVFECEQSDPVAEERPVVRETACVMNRMNGWLSLATEHNTCFLSFFKDRKKNQLIWSEEVTQAVVKRDETVLQMDAHSIEMSAEEIDDWVVAINDNRFDAERHLSVIRDTSSDRLKRFQSDHSINLFAADNDLHARRAPLLTRLRPTTTSDANHDSRVVRFVVQILKLELNSSDRKSVESFFAKMALFDAKCGKISEEFRIDFCADAIGRAARDSGRGFDEQWLSCAKRAQFCCDLNQSRAEDLFLVVRIDKSPHRVLHGVDHFEPFVWSARPVFRADSQQLESGVSFGALYRLDANRLSDDYVTNALNNHHVMRNNTTIGGQLQVTVHFADPTAECQVDSSLFPVTRVNPDRSPELHVQCLRLLAQPMDQFLHLLYVLPQSLKYDSQKIFAKARNLTVEVQIRDSDAPDARPLALIFGRPSDRSMMVSSAFCAVSRHNVCPDFNEEVKIALPLHFNDKLHVLFTYHHVSCKSKDCTRVPVGYSWLPLHRHAHTTAPEALSVFAGLPDGYLSCQWLGLGKGLSMPDVRFVGKDLFRVHLRLVSSVMSRDAHLETAMDCVTRITNANKHDSREVSKMVALEHSLRKQHLKSLLSADTTELIRFSPIIFQQILRLFVHSLNDELIQESLRTTLRLIDGLNHRPDVALVFIDRTFMTSSAGDVHLHEQLVRALMQTVDAVESEDESRVLMRNIWFVFRVYIKACVQHLDNNNGFSCDREDRFPRAHSQHLRQMVDRVSQLIVRNSRVEEAAECNRGCAHFLTRLLSFCDRSVVFNLILCHLNALSSRDVVLSEMRLTAIAIVCAHEHHVPLNNPTLGHSFALSADFCRNHFPIYVLLHEFKHSLSQSVRHVRQLAIQAVKHLLAKHAFDNRYASDRALLARVVCLYAPAVECVIDNMSPVVDTSDHRLANHDRQWPDPQHVRHNSLPVRFDSFNSEEVKDILLVFLFVCCHLTPCLVGQLSAERTERLLVVMETALNTFQYRTSQTCAQFRAKTLPHATHVSHDLQHFLCRQNLSVQTALIAVRTVGTCLEAHPETQVVRKRVVALFLALLSLPQSQHILIHVFDNIRFFASAFGHHLFQMHALLAKLVAKVVHFCDSALKPVRDAAIDLLFCLFGANFKRTRFEVIVCVSRLASNDAEDNRLSRFHFGLNRIEGLARSDRLFADDRLLQTVQRIRDILKATHRIRTDRSPYDNCELRLFLANSYAHTSWSLRRTWLENLSEVHARNNDWAEYSMCLCHVIAIVIQQLSTKGVEVFDARAHISRVSPDLAREDTRADEDWLETEDSHVTVESLQTLIDDCVDALERAELWELATHVLKVLVAFYEHQYGHKRLVTLYERIARMHSRALAANNSGKRLFDTYFRVSISGAHNNEFVYREPKVVSLAEMTAKLERLHPGATILSDCRDGARPESAIFVTHCLPFAPNSACNEFQRNAGINRFQYEQRIETNGAPSGVAHQHKKRVVLTTDHWFPFCLKRVAVVHRQETVLEPLDCAIDEMSARVHQLELVLSKKNDLKHLQLVLQGSVQCQINCGPIAYSQAFLHAPGERADDERERTLAALFDRFVQLCERGLKDNERLIGSDQSEYHNSLKTSFERLRSQLNVQLDSKRTSVQIFDVISGSSVA